MFSPGHVCLLQVLLSSEFPLQVLPNMHLLLRVSIPWSHVTEQVHLVHDDQAKNKALLNKVVNHFCMLSINYGIDSLFLTVIVLTNLTLW